MKLYFYLKSICIIFCALFFHSSDAKSNNTKSKRILEIESILQLSQTYTKDSTAVKEYLDSRIKQAYKENDIPILWAYNIIMADIHSMINDDTNPTSDNYYLLATELLKNGNYPELEFIGNIRQGYYNYTYRKITEAFPLFLEANYIQSRINTNKTPAIEEHCKFIANFFNYIGNNERAIDYLKIALPFSQGASRIRIDLLNSLSLYSKISPNDSLAQYYMNEALKEAEAAKDSVWIGVIYGNLSDYSWKEGKVQEAFQYLKKNIELSLRYNEPLDAMRSNLKIASYYLSLEDWPSSYKHVQNALNLMEDKPYFLAYKVDALKYLAQISFMKGELEEERRYLKQYLQLKELLDQQVNNEEVKKINWRFEVDKYEQNTAIEKLRQKQLIRNYLLIGFTLLLITTVVILLINRSRNKIKIRNIELEKEQLKLAHEKHFLDKELTSVKNSLAEFIETINQNNNIITKLRGELAKNTFIDSEQKNKVTHELNEMLKSHLLTQDRWIEFKNEFEITHPNYLKSLKLNNPLLTENDLRILSLMKLELSNKSMADLLGISLDGIKKAKQRLKKKINTELK